LRLVLGAGAVLLILAAAAYLFADAGVRTSGVYGYELSDEAESFPDAAAAFGLLASATGVVGTWLGFAVRKTNGGLPFSLALCGLGILLSDVRVLASR
jgi:hypothetical protein